MSRQPSHLVKNGSQCPRCRATEFEVLEIRGGLEYRECRRAVCRERFHVNVLPLPPARGAKSKGIPAAAPATPVEEKPKKPRCPYCHNANDITQLSAGRFTCGRKHHPRIVLGPAGEILEAEYPRAGP